MSNVYARSGKEMNCSLVHTLQESKEAFGHYAERVGVFDSESALA